MSNSGTRLIRVTTELLDSFGSRTDSGRKLTAEWGEPVEYVEPVDSTHHDDPEPVYVPTFTVKDDGWLDAQLAQATAAARAEVARQVRETRTLIGFAGRHLLGDIDVTREDAAMALHEAERTLAAVLALLEDAAPRQPDHDAGCMTRQALPGEQWDCDCSKQPHPPGMGAFLALHPPEVREPESRKPLTEREKARIWDYVNGDARDDQIGPLQQAVIDAARPPEVNAEGEGR